MTEKLKNLLHERADAVDFAVPDLEAITSVGDRRIRRRRGTAVVAGLAAVAVVAAVGVAVLNGGDGDTRPQVAMDLEIPPVVTWSTGSVLHTAGERDVDLGHPVRAYVRTDVGYVFSDNDGTVWSFTDGVSTRVGTTAAKLPRLVSDDEDSLAGWVDATGPRPAFVVLDQVTGQTTRNDEHTTAGMGLLADEDDPAYFYALDDGTAYWRDSRGAVAVDLATNVTQVIDAKARNGFDITDVENGLIAFGAETGTRIGRSPGDAVEIPGFYGTTGAFSPDGRWYSGDADEPQIVDTRTQRQVKLDLDHSFATGYDWLGDSTLVVIAQKTESSPLELLTCEVPDGSCRTAVADLGTFDQLSAKGFALPVGENTGD